MLDFEPSTPAYPTHVQDNDSCFRLQQMQADPLAYSPYSPPYSPASFNFDPFADEDSSTSSGASERERELEVQRLRRIEFLRRREWMRRVVAWVDGISHGMTPTLSPSPTSSSKSAHSPGPFKYTPPRDSADVPILYYSSSPSLAGRSDEDDEPYVIYSTPLPGNTSPTFTSPSPSPTAYTTSTGPVVTSYPWSYAFAQLDP
ncbi:hypothetical protein EDB83DRAFT_1559203 [Lactarius deliciosus]|nr:hypothetical protein EDB83DRAFT_1559203 [Lactarius deliciosus]